MCGDGSDVDGYRGFLSLGGHKNLRKENPSLRERQVGMATSGRISGVESSVAHQRIYSEAACCHCGAHYQPSHI